MSTKSQRNSVFGLAAADVQARLNEDGYNELPRPDRRTPLAIVVEVIREPMLLLLLGAGALYLIFGNLGEALVLIAFAMMSVLITVIQESRTERVLEALRDLTSPRALVIRDGERLRILFGPVHIAFLEMLMDPVSSLAFEAESEEEDVMRRPPHWRERLRS